MFTGLVEAVGRIVHVEETAGAKAFEIDAPFVSELDDGQSVAVDGACLTVTKRTASTFSVTAVTTTLEKTVAGTYGVGRAVNLERALRVGDRLDGHLVQGHVDGVAEYVGRRGSEGTRVLTFRLPDPVARVTILQGSITLSGVSLTVSGIPAEGLCEVSIIPHTWDHTNLRELTPGDGVNVEGDLIGKYVQRALVPWKPAAEERSHDL